MKLNIVITCFDRPEHLEKLLESLTFQSYKFEVCNIHLFVDYSEKQNLIQKTINNFNNSCSNFNIYLRDTHFGLKKNVIFAIDQVFHSSGEDCLLLLEDDLILSKYAYQFINDSVRNFANNKEIFGISLYAQHKNPWNGYMIHYTNALPYVFYTLPSSLGSIIFKKNWNLFRQKLNNDLIYDEAVEIPKPLHNWQDSSSWKKQLSKYMVDKNFGYAYPKISYAAHLGSTGTHMLSKNNSHLNSTFPMRYLHFECRFSELEQFDIFFENKMDLRKILNLKDNCKLIVDFYGEKPILYNESYYLTSKKTKKIIRSFGFEFANPICNVLCNIDGDFFQLAKGCDVIGYQDNFELFYEANFTPVHKRSILKYLLKKFKDKLIFRKN